MKRVLILRDCCLGDLLMATPLIRALRETWPGVEVDVAVGPWARAARGERASKSKMRIGLRTGASSA